MKSIILILAILAIPANAYYISIDMPEKNVIGNEFTIYIDANISNFDSANYTINFPDWIEIMDIEEGKIGNSTIPINASVIGTEKCSIIQNMPSIGNVSGNGYLALIKAKALKKGVANFYINGIVSDSNGNEINLTWMNASIKIYETMLKVVAPKEASKNSTVLVSLLLYNVKNINAANFEIDYENLQFINASSQFNFSFSQDIGKLKTFVLFGNESGNFSVATLKFKCMNSGMAKVGIRNVTLSNINASEIEAYIENATITIFDNFAPSANFSWQPLYPDANESIIFNANSSYDSDGYITNYTWQFGDGSTGYGMIVNHSYTAYGEYNITLIVTDDDGAIATVEKSMVVWMVWDVNMDGRANVLDLIAIAQHWNEHGEPAWIRADANHDGIINVLDLIVVAIHWTG